MLLDFEKAREYMLDVLSGRVSTSNAIKAILRLKRPPLTQRLLFGVGNASISVSRSVLDGTMQHIEKESIC